MYIYIYIFIYMTDYKVKEINNKYRISYLPLLK